MTETTTQKEMVNQNELTIKEFENTIHDGKIIGYKCHNCGLKRIDILEFCPNCHKAELEKVEFSGTGSVLTYTIQFVAPEQYMNEVPYAWAIIQLDDGPKITGWIPFISKPSDLPIGQRVRFKRSYLPGIVFEKAS
jgi:uncharacterized OB-fold protein